MFLDERVVLNVRDGDVQLAFSDGSTVDVPQKVIWRSKLLHEAISQDLSGSITLAVPRGVLSSWLECLDALHLTSTEQQAVGRCRCVALRDPDSLFRKSSPGLQSPLPDLGAQFPSFLKVRLLGASARLCFSCCEAAVKLCFTSFGSTSHHGGYSYVLFLRC